MVKTYFVFLFHKYLEHTIKCVLTVYTYCWRFWRSGKHTDAKKVLSKIRLPQSFYLKKILSFLQYASNFIRILRFLLWPKLGTCQSLTSQIWVFLCISNESIKLFNIQTLQKQQNKCSNQLKSTMQSAIRKWYFSTQPFPTEELWSWYYPKCLLHLLYT